MLPTLTERAIDAVEIMDDPNCDAEALRRTYANFRYVNAVVSGLGHTYRRDIRPLLSATEPLTLLDIGSGGGDVPRALARWATRDGLLLTVTAIDPDARAHAYATSRPAVPGLQFRRAHSADLVAAGERFDIVLSNHVLHHLGAAEMGALLVDSERLSRIVVLHGDIERHPLAYLGFGVATWPFFSSLLYSRGWSHLDSAELHLPRAGRGRPVGVVRATGTALPADAALVGARRRSIRHRGGGTPSSCVT